jgi:hypothetical protein
MAPLRPKISLSLIASSVMRHVQRVPHALFGLTPFGFVIAGLLFAALTPPAVRESLPVAS